mgnify:CR=1 FL=1
MTTAYVVVCFSGDGENFLSIYGTYDEEQAACDVCEENNEYESTHHPNDDIFYTLCVWKWAEMPGFENPALEDIVYRVQSVQKNNSSILARFAKNWFVMPGINF